MGSRLLPFSVVVAALAAEGAGLGGAALDLGLLAVPLAAAASFLAVSDALEGRRARLRAVSNGLALVLVVAASAVRENAAHGAPLPPAVTYALVGALLLYLVPTVAWVLEPLRLPRVARARPAPVRVPSTPTL